METNDKRPELHSSMLSGHERTQGEELPVILLNQVGGEVVERLPYVNL